MNCAIYSRYSTDLQSSASIEDQLRLCNERAEAEGWTVLQCYTDAAISGASLVRPGIQQLMQDAMAGRFQVIVAEALDRLSRNLADIAGLYQRLTFAGVKIVTLSEGEISDLHIGLKGTMNSLQLKDLAEKVRRGLRGRVEAGRSGGGNSFGYDVVRRFNEGGEPIRGERLINPAEAGIVRRIFNEFAHGDSPRTIAGRLNAEKIAGPSGRFWGASTIHGHRVRGTGILNNDLYIGRVVWNKLRYQKDPATGKRVSRLNPAKDWIVKDRPELRIVSNDLWQAVKDRQGAYVLVSGGPIASRKRRPKTLFSRLLTCGVCGGGVSLIAPGQFGCQTARNKGPTVCGNGARMAVTALEETILGALRDHLLSDPHLCAEFAAEYARHINQLRASQDAGRAQQRAELSKITRDLDRLVQALLDGVRGAQVKDKMAELEARKRKLEAELQQGGPAPVRLHPNMGERYRQQVTGLIEALNEPDRRTEAAELIRALVDRIVFSPEAGSPKRATLDLHGDLAGILSLVSETGGKPPVTTMVAGAGFEPAAFRL
jgi:site-specific DNA recombinase